MKSTLEGLNKRIIETRLAQDAALTEHDNVIIAALTSANPEAMTQFKEQAHSRVAEAEGARADNNPYVKRLEEMGIKTNPENALAKAKKCEEQWFQLQRLC